MSIAGKNAQFQRLLPQAALIGLEEHNPYWALATKIVDKEVMAEARAIFKAETGKTVSNFALETLLRVHTANLLIAQEKEPAP